MLREKKEDFMQGNESFPSKRSPSRKSRHLIQYASVFFILFCLSHIYFLPQAEATSYQRIVALAPSVTEILFAVGAGDQVVGVTKYCDRPEEAKAIPKVGGFTDHSLEAIVALKPDLVVMTPNRGTKFTYDKLEQIGVESLVLPLYSLEDLDQTLKTAGEKTGNEEGAAKIRQQLNQMKESLREDKEAVSGLRVAFVSWRSPFLLAGNLSLEGSMLEWIGVENIANDSKVRYPRWDIEVLFEKDPDIIIDAESHLRGETLEIRKEQTRAFWKRYSGLRAVKEGRVYLVLNTSLPVPGPRSVDFMKLLHKIIHTLPETDSDEYARVQI